MISEGSLDRFLRRVSARGVVRRVPTARRRPVVESLEERRVLSTVSFADSFAGTGAIVSVEASVMDPAGNTYVTGNFTGSANFGGTTLTSAGNADVFVAKLTSTGSVAWAIRMGSALQSDGDFGRGIARDPSGNLIVSGFFSGPGDFAGINLNNAGGRDSFLVKLNANGQGLWAKAYGSTGTDTGQGVAVDSAGNVFQTGSFRGTAAFGTKTLTSKGGDDVYVQKVSGADGSTLWATGLGGADIDQGFGVAVDPSGNALATGDFSSSATFGSQTLNSAGSYDIYVAKLSGSDGSLTWARNYGGAGTDVGTAVATDSGGNAYVTGDIVGNVTFGSTTVTNAGASPTFDAFVTKFDGAGNVSWAKGFGGSLYDAGFGITTDSANNVYTTGIFQGTNVNFGGTNLSSQGDYDVYLLRLDPNTGNTVEATGFGSANADQSFSVAAGGAAGTVTVTGNYSGLVNLGTAALPGPSGGFTVQYKASSGTASEPPSDFLGLGRTQMAVFRPSTAQWFANNGTSGVLLGTFGGTNGLDIPVAGDFDGTGKTQLAVFRPSTAQWFIVGATGGRLLGTFGGTNGLDIPVPGDYDGTGRTQLAVFRPSTGQWFVQGPTGGRLLTVFGGTNLLDIPAPGDYDGTGRTQVAVFRPSTAQWFIQRNGTGQLLASFGGKNLLDIPAPGDYDGVGHTQVAVFRPSTAQYIVLRATGGAVLGSFGGPNYLDIPTQTNAGALQKLGLIGNGGVRRLSVGGGGGGGGVRTSAVSAPPTVGGGGGVKASAVGLGSTGTAVTVTVGKPTPAVRPKVVVGQGTLTGKVKPLSGGLV